MTDTTSENSQPETLFELNIDFNDSPSLEELKFLVSDEVLSRLMSLCRRFVRDPVDHEQVAIDLWIRTIQRQAELSYTEIRNFCYDVLRHRRVQQVAETEKLIIENPLLPSREDSFAKVELVHELFKEQLATILASTSLSWQERMVLFKLYWHDQPLTQIAKEMQVTTKQITKLKNEMIEKLKQTVVKQQLKL